MMIKIMIKNEVDVELRAEQTDDGGVGGDH